MPTQAPPEKQENSASNDSPVASGKSEPPPIQLSLASASTDQPPVLAKYFHKVRTYSSHAKLYYRYTCNVGHAVTHDEHIPGGNVRNVIAEFGDYHYRRFLQWCFSERQSKAAFLRNMAVARTGANEDLIDRAIEHYCKLYSLTAEELQEYVFLADQNNVSIAMLHDRLEQGLRGESAWGKGTARLSNGIG
jgi:hypothetical protein